MSQEVVLRVYDISRGLAASLGSQLLGQALEGIWHTGVEVFGREFFYGGVIQDMLPAEFERSYGIAPSKLLPIGTTTKTFEEFRAFLNENYNRFTESTYNIINWNCNHFSNECVKFLLNGVEAPREIIHQHEVIQQSPMGASIIGMVQNMAVANPIGGGHANQYQPAVTRPPRILSEEIEQQQLNGTALGHAVTKLINDCTPQQAQSALEMLEKLTSNIVNNSTVAKYRMIKKSNSKLQTVLFEVPNGISCLMSLGFEEKDVEIEGDPIEPGYEFPIVTAPKLRELFQNRKLIQSVLQTKFNVQSSPTNPMVS